MGRGRGPFGVGGRGGVEEGRSVQEAGQTAASCSTSESASAASVIVFRQTRFHQPLLKVAFLARNIKTLKNGPFLRLPVSSPIYTSGPRKPGQSQKRQTASAHHSGLGPDRSVRERGLAAPRGTSQAGGAGSQLPSAPQYRRSPGHLLAQPRPALMQPAGLGILSYTSLGSLVPQYLPETSPRLLEE